MVGAVIASCWGKRERKRECEEEEERKKDGKKEGARVRREELIEGKNRMEGENFGN